MPPVMTSPVPTGTGSAAGASGAGNSTSSRNDGNGDFGKLLGGTPKGGASTGKDTASTGGNRPTPVPGASDPGKPSTDRPASSTASTAPADGSGVTTAGKGAARPGSDKEAPAEDAAAPWPPFGLAGLVLATAPPAEPAPLPGPLPLDPDATSAPLPAAPLLNAAPGPALPTAPGTAAAATPAAEDAPPAALAGAALLPAHGAINADGDDGMDLSTPAPAPLQGIAPSHDLRTVLANAAAFTGEPTPTPVLGDEGFDQAIGARVGWLADQKIGHAHIRLSPDDVGPVDVRLQLNGDKVHASFSSPHVDVRQALESSLPRLRDLLGEQGFQLAHADVGHSPNGGSGDAQPGSGQGRAEGGDGEPSRGEAVLPAAQLIRQRGLLDAYA
ncbi:flagellar hook-length control protein FliK [Stenotrophomonas sp. 24(2023)]|uniref:flagellar hook-length control protein FliK n=1 Tax=Stenotrophomonas sp. 24(2023) TaxID=3068324 RepID=UPI0027DEF5CC|nr:flagellar hook-length control protein FliK [Stenotrophomonas sp. 24(2023)]WMJ71525.1 flagellar hook-length control protein FliK [Stenotrophomonas sp. 24(2023)]